MSKEAKTTKPEVVVKSIQKRDGSIVPFDVEKIKTAIYKAMLSSEEGSLEEAGKVAKRIHADVNYKNIKPYSHRGRNSRYRREGVDFV